MRGESRLWRKLGATEPIFTGWSETADDLLMGDDDIKSITITRGSAGSTFGVQDHTLEVSTRRPYRANTNQPFHLDLTEYGAQLIRAKVGGAAETIRPRYFGRIGAQTVDDFGGGYDITKWHVSLACSKWQSQLANSARVGNQISGQTVWYLMDHFLNPSIDTTYLPYMPPPVFADPHGDYGTMVNDYDLGTAKIPFSDFANKYLADTGFYVQNDRAGVDRVQTIRYRWNRALDRLESWFPITRSQVLAPTKWEQPNPDLPSNHKLIWQDANGIRQRTFGPDPNDVRIPLTEHDLSYVRFNTDDQPVSLGTALYAVERGDKGYRLPSVTIDLLRLIDSPNVADRTQARQLLGLNMGDPVYLSGDWYRALGGIQFASGIKETISADGWEIELSLSPSLEAVGHMSPKVPARVWDSARHDWDEETREWNQA